MTRPSARRPALLPALVATLALVAGGCGDETPSPAQAQAGLVSEAAAAVSGTAAAVVVPTGELTVHVGTPVDSVPADQTARLEPVRAPEGGSVLPIGMSFDQGAAPLGGVLAFPAVATQVSVRACGRDYSVGDAYVVGADGGSISPLGAPGYFVTLPCAPRSDVVVVVSYDGVDQTVDARTGDVAPGRAGTIGALGTDFAPSVDCPTDDWNLDAGGLEEAHVDCAVSAVYRTPYLPGKGWADEGQQWVVADVAEIRLLDASVAGGDGATTDLAVTALEDASTLDGVDATQALVQQPDPRTYVAGGTWVFAVPKDSSAPVAVDLVYRLEGSRSVHVTGAIALPRP
ncbi:MAG: hypothetical protein JWO76_2172 [Nocardioides sp.]|nr:hypothetical protein [Nocardioides sp.]